MVFLVVTIAVNKQARFVWKHCCNCLPLPSALLRLTGFVAPCGIISCRRHKGKTNPAKRSSTVYRLPSHRFQSLKCETHPRNAQFESRQGSHLVKVFPCGNRAPPRRVEVVQEDVERLGRADILQRHRRVPRGVSILVLKGFAESRDGPFGV